MKSIKNIKKEVLKIFLTATIALFISCDYSYELAEANSKEDLTAPTAFFGAAVKGADEWNKVDFANESISASSYIWDFGDGSETSTDFEPTHSYSPFNATYTITLTVSDANGLTDEYSNEVTIIPDPENPLSDYNLFFDLINTGDAGEPVTIHSFSSYQISKDAFASNTLDKNPSTPWTAEDGDIIIGDIKGDGEFVIYDLGTTNDLRVIQFTTDVKSDSYGYQIWTSNTGVNEADFTKKIPETGDIMLSQSATAEFQAHEFAVPVNARYVKLVGFGRFDATGEVRKSQWTNITQIEFFKDK